MPMAKEAEKWKREREREYLFVLARMPKSASHWRRPRYCRWTVRLQSGESRRTQPTQLTGATFFLFDVPIVSSGKKKCADRGRNWLIISTLNQSISNAVIERIFREFEMKWNWTHPVTERLHTSHLTLFHHSNLNFDSVCNRWWAVDVSPGQGFSCNLIKCKLNYI